jgi:hypothetical protein
MAHACCYMSSVASFDWCSTNTYRRCWYICSNASAIAMLVTSSWSWNLRNSSPIKSIHQSGWLGLGWVGLGWVVLARRVRTSVTGHVHQDVAAIIGQQSLGSRQLLVVSSGQNTQERIDRHLITTVVDLNMLTIQVQALVVVVIDQSLPMPIHVALALSL